MRCVVLAFTVVAALSGYSNAAPPTTSGQASDQLVNLTKDGNTIAVPRSEEGSFLYQGYTEETPEQREAREAKERAAARGNETSWKWFAWSAAGFVVFGLLASRVYDNRRRRQPELGNAQPITAATFAPAPSFGTASHTVQASEIETQQASDPRLYPACPACRAPTTWNAEHERFFCARCDAYLS